MLKSLDILVIMNISMRIYSLDMSDIGGIGLCQKKFELTKQHHLTFVSKESFQFPLSLRNLTVTLLFPILEVKF